MNTTTTTRMVTIYCEHCEAEVGTIWTDEVDLEPAYCENCE